MVLTTHVFFAVTAFLGVQGVPDSVPLTQPLFDSREILELRLATDLNTVLKDI